MLAIGTRFFGKDPAKDLPRLQAFIDAAAKLGNVYVAVNAEQDATDALGFVREKYAGAPNVEAFAVTPWGKFVPALNAIVYKAALAKAEYLLLASTEFPPRDEYVQALSRRMDEGTLVVGTRFAEHEFNPGAIILEGSGTTVPWNTFALWNMRYLSYLGFPLAGDAPFDPSMAGVEEVTAIALHQQVFPCLCAVLVNVSGLGGEWNTVGWDEARLAVHAKKIASKKERPAAQLLWAGLSPPFVIHVAG